MSTNVAYFPSEIDTTLLNLEEPRSHNSRGDWSAELTYEQLPLQIQTPFLRNVFGTSSYTNSNNKTSYSLSYELRDEEPPQKAFKEFLVKLDNWFKDRFAEQGVKGEYFSSIRPSKKSYLPDTFRCKLKLFRDQFDVDLMENNVKVPYTIDTPELIKHGDVCRLVIQLMPVWSAGGRVGISWKVQTIQKQIRANFNVPRPAASQQTQSFRTASQNTLPMIPEIKPLMRQEQDKCS